MLRLLGECHSGRFSMSQAMELRLLRIAGEASKRFASMCFSGRIRKPLSGVGDEDSRSQALLKAFRQELGSGPQDHDGNQVYYCDVILSPEDGKLLLATLDRAANADAERR